MNLPGYRTLGTAPDGEHVLVVMLNRPEVLNALNTQMGRDQLELWTRLAAEPGELRCVVLTGAGDRAFCAGGDLKERDGMTEAAWRAQHEIFERMFMALMELPLPVIAAVNGHAFGGGLEMALACDFIYAAKNARFALSEVSLGIMPGGCGTQNLPRAVGERRAKELILTAQPFTAEEGAQWGLVSRVCDKVLDDALATARRIAANAPLAVQAMKRLYRHGLTEDFSSHTHHVLLQVMQLFGTKDFAEGVNSWLEKRPASFEGR